MTLFIVVHYIVDHKLIDLNINSTKIVVKAAAVIKAYSITEDVGMQLEYEFKTANTQYPKQRLKRYLKNINVNPDAFDYQVL